MNRFNPRLLIEENQKSQLRKWLASGCSPNTKDDSDGQFLIHIAAETWSPWAMRLLAKYGADLEVLNDQGMTALGILAEWDVPILVKLMVSLGANIDQVDAHGSTAAEVALHAGKATSLLALIDLGATTPLGTHIDLWMSAENQVVAERLLDLGYRPQGYDDEGRTALSWAARRGHSRVCKRLLQLREDPNHVDDYGITPLMEASIAGSNATFQVLLRGGGDMKLQCDQGKTAIDYAQESNNLALQRTLTQLRRNALNKMVNKNTVTNSRNTPKM